MINIKELRIGNWVEHNDEWCYRGEDVYQFQWDDSDWYALGESTMFIQNIKPIPLTEQWLIDFGFERRDSSVSAAFHIGINPVTHDWLFDVVWIKDYKEDYALNGFPFYKNGHFEIKHVHQLQNLYFALTGRELTKK